MSQSNYSAGIVFAVVASVIFGLIPLFSVPLLKAGLSVSNVVCYRFAFSTVAMAVVMAVRRTSLKVSLREYGALLMLSFFYAMTALLLTASYKYIPTGIATTIHFLYPVWVTLLTVVFFKEKISKPIIIAMICAINGVAMLSLSGTEAQHISGKGLAIVLGTVVAYGSYLACLPKTSVKSMDGLKVTFWLMLNCTMIFALNIIVRDGISGFRMVPNGNCWMNLMLVSLLPTLVSNLTLIQAVRRIGATATSVMGSLEPLTAVIIGLLVFHEHCTPMQALGIFVVIAAVAMLIFVKGRK